MTTYRMTWPVTDPTVSVARLIEQATFDLRGALALEHLQVAGDPEFTFRTRLGRLRLDLVVPVKGEGRRPRDRSKNGHGRELQPCGTHAAFVRHKNRGEVVDELCLATERAYQRERKRRTA